MSEMTWWEIVIAVWALSGVVFLWMLIRESRRPLTQQELRAEEIEREQTAREFAEYQTDLQEWLQERRID